jgi:hypothetical protein
MALSWHRYGYNSGFTVVKPMLKSRHSNHFTPKNLLEDRFRIFIESYLKIAGRSFLPIKNCWKYRLMLLFDFLAMDFPARHVC